MPICLEENLKDLLSLMGQFKILSFEEFYKYLGFFGHGNERIRQSFVADWRDLIPHLLHIQKFKIFFNKLEY